MLMDHSSAGRDTTFLKTVDDPIDDPEKGTESRCCGSSGCTVLPGLFGLLTLTGLSLVIRKRSKK